MIPILVVYILAGLTGGTLLGTCAAFVAFLIRLRSAVRNPPPIHTDEKVSLVSNQITLPPAKKPPTLPPVPHSIPLYEDTSIAQDPILRTAEQAPRKTKSMSSYVPMKSSKESTLRPHEAPPAAAGGGGDGAAAATEELPGGLFTFDTSGDTRALYGERPMFLTIGGTPKPPQPPKRSGHSKKQRELRSDGLGLGRSPLSKATTQQSHPSGAASSRALSTIRTVKPSHAKQHMRSLLTTQTATILADTSERLAKVDAMRIVKAASARVVKDVHSRHRQQIVAHSAGVAARCSLSMRAALAATSADGEDGQMDQRTEALYDQVDALAWAENSCLIGGMTPQEAAGYRHAEQRKKEHSEAYRKALQNECSDAKRHAEAISARAAASVVAGESSDYSSDDSHSTGRPMVVAGPLVPRTDLHLDRMPGRQPTRPDLSGFSEKRFRMAMSTHRGGLQRDIVNFQEPSQEVMMTALSILEAAEDEQRNARLAAERAARGDDVVPLGGEVDCVDIEGDEEDDCVMSESEASSEDVMNLHSQLGSPYVSRRPSAAIVRPGHAAPPAALEAQRPRNSFIVPEARSSVPVLPSSTLLRQQAFLDSRPPSKPTSMTQLPVYQ